MTKLTEALKRSWIIALLCAIPWLPARAQSVAETLQKLTAKVDSLNGNNSVGSLPAWLSNAKNIHFDEGVARFNNVESKQVVYIGESTNKDGKVGISNRVDKATSFL